MEFIFVIIILIFSAVIHEVAHGVAAYWLGDPTAKDLGRLTLNPLPHLDPVGSVLVPLILSLPVLFGQSPGFIIGWAKPVPYNPYNLRNQRWGPAIVGVAGPLSNIIIAFIMGIVIRFGFLGGGLLNQNLLTFFGMIVFINLLLAVFNLVPIPPLDGSKLLFSLMPAGTEQLQFSLERYGFLFLLLFLFFGFGIIYTVVNPFFHFFTGWETLEFLAGWQRLFP